MDDYRFLSPADFQKMCRGIIQIRDNVPLESFAMGKDQGIDYRGIINGKTLIVQAKSTKSYTSLKNELKNVELAKVKKLKPERYILMVAMPLSTTRKDEILEIFKGYITDNLDLISGADIENYLSQPKYSSVRKFYQQKAILNIIGPCDYKIVNDNPFVNCKWLYHDILNLEKYYVETRCFEMVKEHIKYNNIIILTGDPGSGKTTNAKMAVAYLLDKNEMDEVIELKNCNDFFKYYDGDKKQIFFFDDFWGSTFKFNYFSNTMEQDLLNMFNLIGRNYNSYLIMTTREYVLKQGLNALHIPGGKEVEKRIYHSNSDFTKLEKTKILLSHVLNSDLDYNVISILRDKANDITEMTNYSPRTISFYIEQHLDDEVRNGYDFFYDLMNYLKNPEGYFENIFYKLSKGSRIISYIMAISNPPIYIDKLKECFIIFCEAMEDKNVKIRGFYLYVQELEDTFTKYDDDRSIDFINHGIHDFINDQFQRNYLDYKKYFIHSITYFDQYTNLLLSDDIQLNKQDASVLANRLMDNFDSMGIISVYGDELDIFANPSDIFSWYHQKIWLSIQIAEKYHDKGLMEFLTKKTLWLIDYYYLKPSHSYEDRNYTSIPGLLKKFEKFGYEFDYKEIGLKFFRGRKYLFELYCVRYGPDKFQKEIKRLFSENRDKIINFLPENLELELEMLSEDGIGIEYDQLLNDFKKICTYFDVPYSKKLAKIIDDNKIEYNVQSHFGSDNSSFKESPAEMETKEYLKRVHDSFYDESYLDKYDVLLTLENENFKDEIMTKIVNALKNDNKYSIFSSEVSKEYLDLIFLYIKETDDVDLSCKLYPKLVEFIIDKTDIDENVLYGYAYYKDIDGSFISSRKHLINKFNISNKDIDELIKLGVFKGVYKLVDFTNSLFEDYLRVMYVIRKGNDSFDDYKRYFNGDITFLSGDYEMFEYFDTKRFNEIFLKELFKNVINDSYSIFKGKIFEIEFDVNIKDIYSYTTFNDENYLMMSDLYENFYGISMVKELIDFIKQTKWFNKCDSDKIKISEFYKDNKENEDGKYLDSLCEKYYNLTKDTYDRLVKLGSGEMIEFSND